MIPTCVALDRMRYFIILSFLVFALAERKNQNDIIGKYHAAAGYDSCFGRERKLAKQTMRIAIANIYQETNTFAAAPTTLPDFMAFGLLAGGAIAERFAGTATTLGGFLEAAERLAFTAVPLLYAEATPGGIVTAEAFGAITQRLAAALAEHGPFDGVLLGLHGAMVAEYASDADGALLSLVRGAVGPRVPIVATLDLHANLSPAMLQAADALIGYDTYPHVDTRERASEAAELIVRIIRGEVQPVAALVKPPMLPTSQRMPTDGPPMADLIALAHECERDARVLNASVFGGFPLADVAEAGFGVVVTTDRDADLARGAAERLARAAWEARAGFLGGSVTLGEGVAQALALADADAASGPVVLVDIADNSLSGGPGDGPALLAELLHQTENQEPRTENRSSETGSRFLVLGSGIVMACIADPQVVDVAAEAGIGATIECLLGGKTDRLHGAPLPIQAVVERIEDGRFVNGGPMWRGAPSDVGACALLRCGAVRVLVTSRRHTPIDLELLRHVGVEPTAQRLIALKGKGHFRAAYGPIARAIILAEGPGTTGSERSLRGLPFRHVRRPAWPLDMDAQWDDYTFDTL
jgi:microcystin degradation protein MlrC